MRNAGQLAGITHIRNPKGGMDVNKSQIIAHTKDYMDMLTQGIDPISRRKIEDDSVVLQPRMQKCFEFISEVFD